MIAARDKTRTSHLALDSIFLLMLLHAAQKDLGSIRKWLWDNGVAKDGRLAQLVRAPALQAGGRRFESCTAHQLNGYNLSTCRQFESPLAGLIFVWTEPQN